MFNGFRLWLIEQRTIELDVALWEHDRSALQASGAIDQLEALAKSGLKIRVADFVTNGLFAEQKTSHPRYADEHALRRLVSSRLPKLIDYFDFSHGTVHSNFQRQDDSDKGLTEVVGIAGAISVMNGVYGVTQADWRKIPIKSSKALDFDRFSNGVKIVSVEGRGRLDPANVATAVAEVHAKKAAQRGLAATGTQPLFGIVTVPGVTRKDRAVCYVCDPAMPEINFDPQKYKLLSRLAFFTEVIAAFSRSYLLQSLVQRITDIALLDDYRALNGSELLNRRGEPLSTPAGFRAALTEKSPLPIVGDFRYSGARESLLFFGLAEPLIPLLVSQDFDAISRYQNEHLIDFEERVITATVATRQLRFISGSGINASESEAPPGRTFVRLRGALGTSKSGVVFGEFVPDTS